MSDLIMSFAPLAMVSAFWWAAIPLAWWMVFSLAALVAIGGVRVYLDKKLIEQQRELISLQDDLIAAYKEME